MANMKIVSMVDAAALRSRAAMLDDLAHLATNIAQELMLIDERLRKLQEAVDRLQQGGGVPEPSANKD